ncbi:MAG TPA: BTAD domain-containing putative transcriptional regulator, partial [Miltoncostaeaceae bacterium]|nr:BTAD domain-containing putative transcriptional regulator [Miltoncostaeaceae bacterium]
LQVDPAAGIVFEALRGAASTGEPDSADPFFAYLGSEVLGELPHALRDAVVRSAVLDTVSPGGLAAILDDDEAAGLYAEILRRHLPGTPEPDGLRYHPRFREYLLALLARERPDALATLRARYAGLLRRQGHVEEAARHLLDADARHEAEEVVEEAMPGLMRRGDWERVLAWCDALGEDALARRPALRGAQVRALLMSRRQEDVVRLVEAMRATGEFARLTAEAPDVAAWAVWSLHGAGDWRRVRALMPPPGSCRRARAMAHILDVGIGEEPAAGFGEEDLDRPWPLHVALQSAAYYRGAFADVEQMAEAARARGPVTATLAEIYRVAVLRARGDLAEARAVLEGAAPRIRASRFIEFWQWAEAELAAAEGDHEGGLRLIRAARRTSRDHGYPVADRAVFAVAEGRMLVRLGRMPEAAEVLERSREWSAQRGLAVFREWAETWLAAVLLGLGNADPTRPRALLQAATGGMSRAARRLELPAASVLLAEAEWRAGDEWAHDRAADAGYEASLAMGTLAPLIDALDLVPDVLARRMDAAAPGDDRWRLLARRGPGATGAVSLEAAHVVVRTLGTPRIEVGGRTCAVSSPKAVELAAALARAGARGVPRARLAAELFPEGAGAGNALRQLLHRLRRALPAGAEVVTTEGRLAWLPADAVVAEDHALEVLIARSRCQVGAVRLDSLRRALELAARGPYLPDADGEAARRRRDEVGAAVAEARREYAAALLAAGRTGDAREVAAAAVGEEPYREDAWRLLMRSEALLGGPASALAAYLGCRRALGEVGLDPSPETEVLLDRLRNAPPADADRGVTGA